MNPDDIVDTQAALAAAWGGVRGQKRYHPDIPLIHWNCINCDSRASGYSLPRNWSMLEFKFLSTSTFNTDSLKWPKVFCSRRPCQARVTAERLLESV